MNTVRIALIRSAGLILLLGLSVVAMLTGTRAYAALTSQTGWVTQGACVLQGESGMASNYSSGYSTTYPYYFDNRCVSLEVHAYFWGSDYAWHYYESTAWSPTVSFPYWTNNIYGYHSNYGYPTPLTTNAY